MSSAITFVKESELLQKAAKVRDLVLKDQKDERSFDLEPYSEGVGKFKLTSKFLGVLKEYGFTFTRGEGSLREKMIYLSGNSDQHGREIFDSDCWAWDTTKVTDHELEVHFRLKAVEDQRGVRCEPHIWGNNSGGACHQPTISKFMQALAKYSPDTHYLIREFENVGSWPSTGYAHSCSWPVIHWSEFGEGGIKSVGSLFRELFSRNETVLSLVESRLSPFDPHPHAGQYDRPKDHLFVRESEQPKLFKIWKDQLEKFKNKLC